MNDIYILCLIITIIYCFEHNPAWNWKVLKSSIGTYRNNYSMSCKCIWTVLNNKIQSNNIFIIHAIDVLLFHLKNRYIVNVKKIASKIYLSKLSIIFFFTISGNVLNFALWFNFWNNFDNLTYFFNVFIFLYF